jgi:hypothetical protein
MTLNASGPISLGGSTTGQSINLELSQSATAQVSLNDTNVRTLAGAASGAIVMPTNFYGKSAGATWSPDGGPSAGSPVALSDDTGTIITPSSVTITCSQTAVWNWTRTGSSAGTATVVNGGSATSITFELPNPTSTPRFCTFTVNSVVGGVTKYWTVSLTNNGSA